MEIYNWLIKHWLEIGFVWLAAQKFLTAVQDSVDAQPKDLKPPFGKLLYYMGAIGGYLFAGNRPQAIIPKILLIMLFCFGINSYAQSTNTLDISSIISKLTLHEAVGYDIKSGNMTSYTSADIIDWKSLSLSAGYSTSSAIVASVDFDLGGFNKLGITSPLLSVVDLRVGMMVGLSNISTATSGGTAERNKLSWGPEVTIVSVKF